MVTTKQFQCERANHIYRVLRRVRNMSDAGQPIHRSTIMRLRQYGRPDRPVAVTEHVAGCNDCQLLQAGAQQIFTILESSLRKEDQTNE